MSLPFFGRSIFIADDFTLNSKSTQWNEVVKSSKMITGFKNNWIKNEKS